MLQSASFAIKQKHPAAKRNVLFEDESLDLVLDFCLREGETWRRMTVEQAAAVDKKRSGSAGRGRGKAVRDDELEDILVPNESQ